MKNLRFFAFLVHFNPILLIMHKHHFQSIWMNLSGDHSCNSVFFRFRIPIYFDVRIKSDFLRKLIRRKKWLRCPSLILFWLIAKVIFWHLLVPQNVSICIIGFAELFSYSSLRKNSTGPKQLSELWSKWLRSWCNRWHNWNAARILIGTHTKLLVTNITITPWCEQRHSILCQCHNRTWSLRMIVTVDRI